MRPLTREIRSYIAGVMDGEGTISITRVERSCNGSPRNPNYSTLCCVTNTNKDLMNWLRNKTGIGQVVPKKKEKATHKQCYRWIVETAGIATLLIEIKEFLVVKHEQAHLMLEFLKDVRPPGGNTRDTMSLDQAITKDLIYREMAELNKRGVTCPR